MAETKRAIEQTITTAKAKFDKGLNREAIELFETSLKAPTVVSDQILFAELSEAFARILIEVELF